MPFLRSSEGYRKKPALPRQKHKKGGQPGHPGNTLKMVDTPDEVVELKPEVCQACRRELAAEVSDYVMVSRQQALDVPPMSLRSTEYCRYGCSCAHGGAQNQLFKAGFEEEPPPRLSPHSRGRPLNIKGRNLLIRLKEKQEAVLAFAWHRCVPFTNNLAERDIRVAKTQLKVAGCFRTWKGAQVYARINGFISTLRKQGLNPLNELRNIFNGGIPSYRLVIT